jgi:adenylate kinase family enzyme
VGAIVGEDSWVIDGNYSSVRDLVWARADTVVWFDLPKQVVMRQVIGRTLRRTIRREELWNGNREPLANLWRPDPQHNIILWAWTNHSKYRKRFSAAVEDERYAGLRFVRLGSRGEVERLLSSIQTEG